MEFNLAYFCLYIQIYRRHGISITPFHWVIWPYNDGHETQIGKDEIWVDKEDTQSIHYGSRYRYLLYQYKIRFLCLTINFSVWKKTGWHQFPSGYDSRNKKIS